MDDIVSWMVRLLFVCFTLAFIVSKVMVWLGGVIMGGGL